MGLSEEYVLYIQVDKMLQVTKVQWSNMYCI